MSSAIIILSFIPPLPSSLPLLLPAVVQGFPDRVGISDSHVEYGIHDTHDTYDTSNVYAHMEHVTHIW